MIQTIQLNLFRVLITNQTDNNSLGIESYNVTALRRAAICAYGLPVFV